MKLKKSYGQHLLIDEVVIRSIVDDILTNLPTKNVLEIGPGQGAISKYLVDAELNYKAVELDLEMIEYLKLNFDLNSSQLIHGSFLRMKLSEIFEGEEFAIVGNFPYNISSQILFKMEKEKTYVPYLYGMFQKEVAQRVVAGHGNKTYGILSVLMQAYYNCELMITMGPEVFYPPPKVRSATIQMKRQEKPTISVDHGIFKQVVKMAFNQRRKMLRNSLKTLITNSDLADDPVFTKRPEQLSVIEFNNLTKMIDQINKDK